MGSSLFCISVVIVVRLAMIQSMLAEVQDENLSIRELGLRTAQIDVLFGERMEQLDVVLKPQVVEESWEVVQSFTFNRDKLRKPFSFVTRSRVAQVVPSIK